MDYYEELGISASASAEDIRRAYKNLARLFHPDCQNDPELRRLGDIQMKRLNSIVAVLLDSRERRQYDSRGELLREGRAWSERLVHIQRPRSHVLSLKELWSSSRLGLFIWAAAALILVATMTVYFSQGTVPLLSPGERVNPDPGATADIVGDPSPAEQHEKTPPRGAQAGRARTPAPAPDSPKEPSGQDRK